MIFVGGTVQIRDRMVEDVAVLELTGRLTVSDNPGLIREAVADALRRGARHVALDLTNVHYIDSTRLGELIAVHVTLSRAGGRLTLVGTPARVLELLTLAGLDTVFERFGSVDEALTSLARRHGGT